MRRTICLVINIVRGYNKSQERCRESGSVFGVSKELVRDGSFIFKNKVQ